MRNLAGTETGTSHSYLLPEPDGYITSGWAQGIVRTLSCLHIPGVLRLETDSYSSGGTHELGTRIQFSKLPLVCLYEMYGSTVYYQNHVLGTLGNTDKMWSDAITHVAFLDEAYTSGQADKAVVYWGNQHLQTLPSAYATICAYFVGK